LSYERQGITAAGTVADSDRIPFSLQQFYFTATPKHYKYMRIKNTQQEELIMI